MKDALSFIKKLSGRRDKNLDGANAAYRVNRYPGRRQINGAFIKREAAADRDEGGQEVDSDRARKRSQTNGGSSRVNWVSCQNINPQRWHLSRRGERLNKKAQTRKMGMEQKEGKGKESEFILYTGKSGKKRRRPPEGSRRRKMAGNRERGWCRIYTRKWRDMMKGRMEGADQH